MSRQKSPVFDSLKDAIRPVEYERSTFCLVRRVTEDDIEASFDFGAHWDRLPISEIVSASVVRSIEFPKATYQLCRLVVAERHPTIQLAAVEAQLRVLQAPGCCCGEPEEASSSYVPRMRMDPDGHPRPGIYGHAGTGYSCFHYCADEKGVDFWACVCYCAFIR